jgi:hypothetical protein
MEAPPPVNGWDTPLSVSIFLVCIVFAVLTGFFTLLRFIARSGKFGTYGPDDWVILSASVRRIDLNTSRFYTNLA